jgi:ABC-type sugar transport system substrate-binding protein
LVLIRTEGWLRDDLQLGGRLEGKAWADYMGLTGGLVVVLVV